YWTFGDVFEESGVPFTHFYGGFGLVTNGLVKKPTFYTFKFFKRLKGQCVHRSDESVICKKQGGYNGVIWNLQMEDERERAEISFKLPADKQDYCLAVWTVDEVSGNPLKTWHDIGEPSSPSAEQLQLMRESAVPAVSTIRLSAKEYKVAFSLELAPNAVAYFELLPAEIRSDRGYDYERAVNKNG
ncbi:MAG: xylan 1,4-beta-xylosidase, partial [Eubacteriales bacterium]|nr:xylan 1,4-beta-xylosidase [Eubacteriales bacterium]